MKSKARSPQRLIALAGFAPEERSALEACLQTSWFLSSGYGVTRELRSAAVVIGNADESSVLRVLRARPGGQKVVLVGDSDGGTGWPLVPRRFQAAQLARELNGQMGVAAPSGDTVAAVLGCNVLLVDESEIGLRLTRRQLEGLGVSVKVARSGAEAVNQLAHERFSHVLLDVMVSGMDGFRICRAIKELPLAPGNMPCVILMTSVGGAASKHSVKLSGCDDFLVKPVSPGQLASALGLEALRSDSFH